MEQHELGVGEEWDDERNIIRTSLVEKPATQKLWAIFSDSTPTTHKLKVLNLPTETNEQVDGSINGNYDQIISGVWFMPDTDYVRLSEQGKVYTARMSREQLTLAHTNFKKSGMMNNFDVKHDGKEIDGLVTIETWQLFDHEQKSPTLGKTIYELGYKKEDIPLGTVFMSVFVKDTEFFYNKIESGELKGFSIEGLFNINKINDNEMNKFKEMFHSLGLDQTVGTLISNSGQKVMFSKEGIKVDELDALNEEIKLTSGFTLVFRDGKLADFGFNEEATLSTGDSVETVEETIETVEEVVNEAEQTEEEIVELPEVAEVETPVKSVQDQIDEAVAKALDDQKTNQTIDETDEVETKVEEVEEVDPRDAKIKELQDQLDATKAKEVAPRKKKLKSIPKLTVEKTDNNSNKYYTKTVGSGPTAKTYRIRKA